MGFIIGIAVAIVAYIIYIIIQIVKTNSLAWMKTIAIVDILLTIAIVTYFAIK